MPTRLLSRLSPEHKSRLRGFYYNIRRGLVDRFRSFGAPELRRTLMALGVERGDTLMVHAGFDRLSGFQGSPSQFIDVLVEVLGPDGHLLMVSMAYSSSAHAYLTQRKPFDVRKTISHMGLISETFRRRPGVIRSMHPSNPVLALGPRAAWIVEGHETCRYPCGLGTPFEKMAQLKSKVLFFNASILTLTFFHYLEDIVERQLPFPLFLPQLIEAHVIDYSGNTRVIETYAYSDEAIRRRHPEIMNEELDKQGLIRRARVGNSKLTLVSTPDIVRVVKDMAARGVFFYK